MIKKLLYIPLAITAIMTLINMDNFIYMIVAALVNSGFWLYSDLRSKKINWVNAIFHSIIMILTFLIFIKIV